MYRSSDQFTLRKSASRDEDNFRELPNRARFTFRGRSFVKTVKSMSEDGIAMEIFFRPKLKWRSRNLTVFLRPVLSKPIDNGKVSQLLKTAKGFFTI